MSRSKPFAVILITILLLWLLSLALPAFAQPASQGHRWALLIGAEKYHRATRLKYTTNDVQQLGTTLKTRGDYSPDRVLEITDDAPNPRFQPLRASLLAELPGWFKKVGANDSVLVYFSGHGFRSADGKLYIAPLDCDPANPAATGVPAEWLREQIAGCKAKFKLLILDSCHAGSEKGDDDGTSGVASKDLGEQFRGLEGVVTLASSTAEEKSQLWDEKQQSLFSYWLNQGLRGHADERGNGAVDIDDLYRFVHRNVTQTAKAHFPRSQTPVRIVRSGTPDVPVVVQLKPQTLRQLLADIADQLADNIADRRMNKVGVLEFTNDTRLGELLGADFGTLGKWCADELERKLMDQGTGKFTVVDRRRLQKALKDDGFKLEDLGSSRRLKQLSKDVGGMPVMAVGTLANRKGRVVTIQCKLQSLESDEMAGSAGGRALLNESEWAMLGKSVEIKPEDRRPEPMLAGVPTSISAEDTVVHRADERARGPHPLQNPNFDFPIKIMVAGKERKPVFKKVTDEGNEHWDCIIPVSVGETYEVWIQNRTGASAIMRLLIDGLNSKLEKEDVKGIETMVWGKRVNLDEAKGWILDPAENDYRPNGIPAWRVQGFETESGELGKMRLFTILEAEKSLAARQQFTDQIGIITAAFYSEAATPRGSVGTGAGDEINVRIKQRNVSVGNLLSVVHIRYVDAKTLEAEMKK